ncbi:MAG: hypothetical protein JWR80_8930 [Bradyrhizobium sp.]|nr:hypothetical protein [Bradyrhizobium sp.]
MVQDAVQLTARLLADGYCTVNGAIERDAIRFKEVRSDRSGDRQSARHQAVV